MTAHEPPATSTHASPSPSAAGAEALPDQALPEALEAPIQLTKEDSQERSSASPLPAPTAERLPIQARLLLTALTYFAIPASLAGAVWFTLYPNRTAHIVSNAMVKADRNSLLFTMAIAGTIGVVGAAIPLIFRRRREYFARLERAGRLGVPLSLSVFLPLFFDWRVFSANEFVFVISATLFGLALEATLRVTFSEVRFSAWDQRFAALRARFPKTARRLPTTIAWGLALSFCAYFSFFTVRQHLNLMTYSWDMAIFNNMMWNLLRGEWFKASPVLGVSGSHIQYHATFIAYALAPFYALYQKAESLLVIQASLAGLGAVPIYLVARRRLGSSLGALILSYAYLVHAPLHGPLFYDFHFITTAPFWVGWVLYFYETERKGWLIVTWALAFLVREEVSASLAAVALFYLLSGKRPTWAIVGGVCSVAYFFLVKFVVMPLHRTGGPDKQTFAWIFQGLIPPGEEGLNGVIRTLVSNPIFTLSSLLDSDKLVYVLKTFGPLVLLPLRNRLTWLFFVPATIFTLLSTGYKPLIETYFQYTSNYTPYLFFAAAIAIAAKKPEPNGRARGAAALGAVLCTATIFSFNEGALFQHNNFRGGFHTVRFERTHADKKRYAQLYELIAMIPPRATVMATEMEAPHVSSRPDCFTMRFNNGKADYLLVNLDEASFAESRTHLIAALNTGKYGFVASRGRFALWSTKVGHEKDAEGAKLLGIPTPRPR